MLEKRIFKKYPNRRLYDTKNSCYVNLETIKDCVLALEPVEVIDVQTAKDITPSVLLQIINKQHTSSHQSSLMTSQTLHNLILLYNTPYGAMLNQFLENATSWITAQQGLNLGNKKSTSASDTEFNPFNMMADFSGFSNSIQENWNDMMKNWIK